MIKTKEDLRYYIERDMFARFGGVPTPAERYTSHLEISFNKTLRTTEYHVNNGHTLRAYVYKARLLHLGRKLGWTIGLNVFGPGMCIVHYGTVIVNTNARIGENARIHAGVNIGASGGRKECPQIGDNVYFGPGAKIFGDIKIGSNVAIGANAVVCKSCEKENVTLGGVPAKIISHKGTEKIIKRYEK